MAPAGLECFRPRAPWLGADLQTLRDSLRPVRLPPDQGQPLSFELGDGDQLLGLLDRPVAAASKPGSSQECGYGLVLVVHGLGGGSDRLGVRRLALTLQQAGCAVLRLNLRGAGPGRPWARGTYAACSNRDLLQVLPQLRRLAAGAPLLGVGLSLGGSNLLNAVLADRSLLDGLVCISSPLDLLASSQQIAQSRNRLYERWLLRRLVRDTRADPHGLTPIEREGLGRVRSIRDFDALITAPRWSYDSVDDYYHQASVLPVLLTQLANHQPLLPPTLLLHALDDPWVPAGAAQQLAAACAAAACTRLAVVLTASGGHNGFHGIGDGPLCSWSDALVRRWILARFSA